jgi:hypothetical protein
MTSLDRTRIALYGGVVAIGLGLISVAIAQEGHHATAPHGGTIAMKSNHHFEAVFSKDGITLYPMTAAHKPVDGTHLSARATFYQPNSPTSWFSQRLHAGAGPGAKPLVAEVDLSQVPSRGVTVTFQVAGLPDPHERSATFTVPFSFEGVVPVTFATATPADESAVKAQKLCVAAGGDLNAMGTPLKVTHGEQSVFVCCEECVKKVQTDPDRYFGAKVAPAAGAASQHQHQGHGH